MIVDACERWKYAVVKLSKILFLYNCRILKIYEYNFDIVLIITYNINRKQG